MMPTLAQGAAIALEDGMALARHLARRDEPRQALAAYEAERRPRARACCCRRASSSRTTARVPAPPPLSRDWIFAHDATVEPVPA